MAAQCKAIKSDGTRCRQGSSLSDDRLCLFHDPDRKRAATIARKRGGKAAQKKRMDGKIKTVSVSEAPPAPETIDDCAKWASWAVHAVAVGLIDARTADAVGKLLNALQRALKDSKVEADVAELRTQLAELRRGSVGVVR